MTEIDGICVCFVGFVLLKYKKLIEMKLINQCKSLKDGRNIIAIRILLCFVVMSSCMVLGEYIQEEVDGNTMRRLSSSSLLRTGESEVVVQLSFYVSAIQKLQTEKKLSGNDLTLLTLVNSTSDTVYSSRVSSSSINIDVHPDTYVLHISGRLVNRPCIYTDLPNNCFGNSLISIRATSWGDQVTIYAGPINSEIKVDLKYLVTPLAEGNQPCKMAFSSSSSTNLLLYNVNETDFTEQTTWPSSIAQTDNVIVRYSFSISSSQLTSGLDIRVRSATPLIIMLNSIRIYTEPSPSYRITGSSREWQTVAVPGHLLIEGQNVLAVFVTSKQTASVSSIFFDCTVRLLMDNTYRYLATEQTVTGNYPVFDYDVSTAWSVTILPDAQNTLIYAFPFDSVEGVTSLCFHILNEETDLTPVFTISYQIQNIVEIQSFTREEKESTEIQSDGSIVVCYRIVPLAIYRRFILTFKNTGTTSMNVKIGEVQPKMKTVFRSETTVMYPQTVFTDVWDTVCVNPSTTTGVTQFTLFSSGYTALPSIADITLNATTGQLCVLPTGHDVSFYVGVFGDEGYHYIPITVTRSFLGCETESGERIDHGARQIFENDCPMGFVGDTYQICLNGTFTEIQMDLCEMIPPSPFSYSVDERYLLYEPLSLTPSNVSMYSEFSITPSLPEGLFLNTTNGVISGVPVDSVNEMSFTVTQSNDGGSQTTVFLLTLVYPPCSSEDGYEGVESGEESSLSNCPEGYGGETYRICFNGTFSEILMDRCVLLPPPSFSYSPESSYYLYQSFSLSPNVTSIIGSFSSSSLPQGLSVDTTTGLISGIPVSNGSFIITIDATNDAGTTSSSFSLTLLYLPCSLSNDDVIASGDRIYNYGDCDYGYEGGSYRICFNGTLSDLNYGDCVLLPPSGLTYATDTLVIFTPFKLIPVITNLVSSFSIVPSLPDSLVFNTTTGVIEGIATAPLEQIFTVTALNTVGSTSYVLQWNFVYPQCKENGLIGEYGEEFTVKCYSWSFIGQKSRRCSLEGDSVKWIDLPNTCVGIHATVCGACILVCVLCVFMVFFLKQRGSSQVKVTVGEVYL